MFTVAVNCIMLYKLQLRGHISFHKQYKTQKDKDCNQDLTVFSEQNNSFRRKVGMRMKCQSLWSHSTMERLLKI